MNENGLHQRLDLLERALIALAAVTLPRSIEGLTDDEVAIVERLRELLAELDEVREKDVNFD